MAEGLSKETHRKYIEHKQSAKFLFSPKDGIYDSLDKIHTSSFKVSAFKNAEKHTSPDLLAKLMLENEKGMGIIISEIESLDGKMNKYLKFYK